MGLLNDKVVYITGYKGELGSKLAQCYTSLGAVVVECEMDVTNPASIDQCIDETLKRHRRIDIWVNNAGVSRNCLLAAEKDQELRRLFEINLESVIKCSRAVIKAMLPARSGVIINISSLAAWRPENGQSLYAASKGGVESFTRALAKEVAGKAIRVNAVAPGFLESKMTEGLDESHKVNLEKRIPLGRMGQLNEVAGLVAFLSSDEAAYITGQIVRVDGGLGM
ncbi:MAG: SDR family oxidoreductase [Verrucomicrobiota bacterium]